MKKTIKKATKKATKKVSRAKLQVVDTPVSKHKNREFWQLFPNVRNHKLDAVMHDFNLLDDFIKIIEDLSQESFDRLFNLENKYHLDQTVSDLHLKRYKNEISYLFNLIQVSKLGKAVPYKRSCDEFQSHISISEDTKRKMDHISNDCKEPSPSEPSEPLVNLGEAVKTEMEKISELAKELQDLKKEDKDVYPIIEETWSEKAQENVIKFIDDVKSQRDKNKVTENKKPQFLVERELAEALLDKFDEEYSLRMVRVACTKRQLKNEKKRLATTTDNDVTSLKEDAKAFLKARRDYLVIKKVWKKVLANFKNTKIEDVDLVALAAELQKITPPSVDYSNLFDNSFPTKDQCERERQRRGKFKNS